MPVICDTAVPSRGCIASHPSITTLKPDGGIKGSTGDNVWYGQTYFIRIRRYESTFSRGRCSKYPALTSLLRIIWTARLDAQGPGDGGVQRTTRIAGHLGGLFGGRLFFPPEWHASGKDGGHCGWRPLFFLCPQRIGAKPMGMGIAFGFVASPIPSFDSGLHRLGNSLGTQSI